MKAFLLLILLPNLISGDTLCPHSKTTCPGDKQCCEIDGEHTCCDPDDGQDTPAIRMKVLPGVKMMSHVVLPNTSFATNESTLQFGILCELTCSGKCCPNDECCPLETKCCEHGHGCCRFEFSTCCESWCCKTGYRCGSGFQTCISKGSIISLETVVLLFLFLSVFVSRRL
ncbi:unnamed protein product [Larinioides sclopetarius]|uniref:Granulin n=1 Tax=Larinioides sclopetarius TaxID=280406 RepID=A0AAV2AQF3_9ARAC